MSQIRRNDSNVQKKSTELLGSQSEEGAGPSRAASRGNAGLLDPNESRLRRSLSNASMASTASARSVFSNATAKDLDSCKEDIERCKALRKEEAECIEKIKSQLVEMMKACETQRNVSMTIKEGLKNVKDWIDRASDKHQEADKSDRALEQGLECTEEARKTRQKWREGIQANQIRKVVLECQKRKKDDSPPQKEQAKKVRRDRTFADRVKVSTNKEISPTLPPVIMVEPRKVRETMLIRVAKGQSYASVLGKLKKNVDPAMCQTRVVGARPTQKGDLLLTLGEDSNKEAFVTKVAEIVEGIATVQMPEDQRVTLEIRDLDILTEEEEVVVALEQVLKTSRERRKVKLLQANQRGIKLAVVTATRREAAVLEQLGRVKVGFMSCCVRKRVAVARCHKCLGFGHKAGQCSGVDRSSACYKCGETGHTVANCSKQARCFLCSETVGAACDHISGSGQCTVFRKALDAAKKEEALRRR